LLLNSREISEILWKPDGYHVSPTDFSREISDDEKIALADVQRGQNGPNLKRPLSPFVINTLPDDVSKILTTNDLNAKL
jgi:hypothetical protein